MFESILLIKIISKLFTIKLTITIKKKIILEVFISVIKKIALLLLKAAEDLQIRDIKQYYFSPPGNKIMPACHLLNFHLFQST